MATTLPTESTQHARNGAQKAMAFDHVQRIGGLSRIVDRDIEILKMNLQLHDGRDESRSSAWERLESAWETVRSELADDSVSSPLTGDVSPAMAPPLPRLKSMRQWQLCRPSRWP